MNWYLKVVRDNYANFNGRARRMEYWMFFLINFLIGIGIGIVEYILGTNFLGIVYSLIVLIPGIAVAVRRLHDTGRSGWFLLLTLIPIVGLIVLVFMFTDGTPGENEYGPNPKEFGDGYDSKDLSLDSNL